MKANPTSTPTHTASAERTSRRRKSSRRSRSEKSPNSPSKGDGGWEAGDRLFAKGTKAIGAGTLILAGLNVVSGFSRTVGGTIERARPRQVRVSRGPTPSAFALRQPLPGRLPGRPARPPFSCGAPPDYLSVRLGY